MTTVLVTGAAGFIGFHLCQALLARGDRVIGIDNLNDYYDVTLKKARLAQLIDQPQFCFYYLDLTDQIGMAHLFAEQPLDAVVNLAAQAGVRYAMTNPHAYIASNVVGFTNVLEGCRHSQVPHLVFASSSSVYGANTAMPFSVQHSVDHPISLYAATKRANELMAHTYSYLYGLPTTGLRFFTVYGPWGRPDMSPFIFTKAILARQPIEVFNYGQIRRDFTYIDDIVEGIVRVIDRIPTPQPDWAGAPDPGNSSAPYKLYNLGNQQPVELMQFIELLATNLGISAQTKLLPPQPSDVPETYADVDDLVQAIGFQPTTPIEQGVEQFIRWYRAYYRL
jgi:UDP-glucuronate 4-epimerase